MVIKSGANLGIINGLPLPAAAMAQPADHVDPAAGEAPPGPGEQQPLQEPRDPAARGASDIAPGAPPLGWQLVFVYGTLKRGEKNHHWLKGASWQGDAELHGVVLHDLGPFPMAVMGAGRINGEVYAVEGQGLGRLDMLEGYPRLYDRQVLPLSDGRKAWVYLGRPRQVRHAPVVADGTWNPSSTSRQ
jgi:gamma-glutamylcyclotransferase (GGCT)/AIG2-like uncharacterized protein YtfP